MTYSENDNFLIQGYLTVAFLAELSNLNFLESDYYKGLNFQDNFVHENLPGVGLGNRGSLLIMLYVLLVVPKQLLEETFPSEFQALDKRIEDLKVRSRSTYKFDQNGIEYLRHIRNAVAHARVSFDEPQSVVFQDKSGGGGGFEFEVVITLIDIGEILAKLQSIFMKYIEKTKDGFRA